MFDVSYKMKTFTFTWGLVALILLDFSENTPKNHYRKLHQLQFASQCKKVQILCQETNVKKTETTEHIK